MTALTDIHPKLDRTEGESTSTRQKDAIMVERSAFSVANAASAGTDGSGGAGRATFCDLTFTRRIDRAAPAL